MPILARFLVAVADLSKFVLDIYIFVVIGRAVITWVNADPYNPIVRFLKQATDPLLTRIRRFVPIMGGLDISPMVLILAVMFLQKFFIPILYDIAQGLR